MLKNRRIRPSNAPRVVPIDAGVPARIDLTELNAQQARIWIAAAREYDLGSVEIRFLNRAEIAVNDGTWTPTIEAWNKLNDLAEGY